MTQDQLDRLNAIAEPWPETPAVPPLVHGWTVWSEQFKAALSGRLNPVVVEVGAWMGKTSLHFAQTYPTCCLMAIDIWEERGVTFVEQNIKHAQSAKCFEIWQANLFPYSDRVWALRMRSERGMLSLATLGIEPDLVYIDAAHDFGQVYLDLAVAVACFPGATICGDDYAHGGNDEQMQVGRAVDAYCKRTGRSVTTDGRFWLLNK